MPVVLILGALAIFSYIGGNYNFAEYLRMPFMPAAVLVRLYQTT
jgi:phospho-N-acetylmuramoyl-pentapeptide-transferase